MLLCIEYLPNVQGDVSNSKLVVATPIGDHKMGKMNTFEGDQADLMYGMLVGLNEDGEVKDINEEKEKLQ